MRALALLPSVEVKLGTLQQTNLAAVADLGLVAGGGGGREFQGGAGRTNLLNLRTFTNFRPWGAKSSTEGWGGGAQYV